MEYAKLVPMINQCDRPIENMDRILQLTLETTQELNLSHTDPLLTEITDVVKELIDLKQHFEAQKTVLSEMRNHLPEDLIGYFKEYKQRVRGEYRQDRAYKQLLDMFPQLDEDADLVITGQTLVKTCPLTLQIMTDPYTNSVCGHSYSDAIFESLRDGPIPCPVAGCDQRVFKRNLKRDTLLQRRIQQSLQE
ncbi:hypothetical protein EDD86DRAFT_218823 [Gorgonomyces haynaldii]|nr:hypothetical protein EDD86DRAFT_218823 [Gorgonomyces haynaldii]